MRSAWLRPAPTEALLTSQRPRRTFTPAGSPRPPWASSSARNPRSSASRSPAARAGIASPARPGSRPRPRPATSTRCVPSAAWFQNASTRESTSLGRARSTPSATLSSPTRWGPAAGGPAAGLVVYVAEDVTPTVQVGQHVSSATVIANMYNGGDGIETGWAAAQTSLTAESQMPEAGGIGAGGPFPTMVGLSFDGLLQSLG